MKYSPKLNRRDARTERQAKFAEDMKGTGVILYQNNTRASLNLPKPAMSGKRWIDAGEKFQGDSYFRSLVGHGLSEIQIIIDPNQERNLMEEKLILDQPDRVTTEGTVETVMKKVSQKLNETPVVAKKQTEVLITEDPIDGVEIILG